MKNLSLIVFILLLAQSCSLYRPTTLIPTAFEEKGDSHVNVSTSVFDAIALRPMINANVAYSPINYVYMHAEGGIGASSSSKSSQYNYSGGIGFYSPVYKNFQLETQLSIGQGKFDWGDPFVGSSESFTSAYGDYSHGNGFIALNYKKEDYVIGLAYRFNQVLVDYNKANVDYLSNTSNTINQNDFYLYYRKINPTRRINLFYSLGYAFNGEDFDFYPYNRMIYANVGVLFNLRLKKE